MRSFTAISGLTGEGVYVEARPGRRPGLTGLLQLDVRVRFRDPYLRLTVYRTASPDERRGAHRALAEASNPLSDLDRRAWHRGQSIFVPDESVAAELERTAERARARGGSAAAGAFLERTAALTSDPARLVEAAVRAGRPRLTEPIMERLGERAKVCGTDWALGILHRSRALLDGSPGAEDLYLEAIHHLQRSRAVAQLARTHLLYGEWLRREARRGDALAQLRTAYEMLSSIGAAGAPASGRPSRPDP